MKNYLRRSLALILTSTIALPCLVGCGNAGIGENPLRNNSYVTGRFSDDVLNNANPGVLALLGNCMYYEDTLLKGIKKGQKWVYSNSSDYVPQNGTFDDMVKSKKYGANCAMPQAWALIDMGIMELKHFWGNTDCGISNYDKYGQLLEAAATVTKHNGVPFYMLYDDGNVKPGDIFFCKGHTFIYLGDEKFMAAGHDSKWHSDYEAATEDGNHAVFDDWVLDMNDCKDYSYQVFWQVRFKDDYVPKYYRNTKGKLVENPDYVEITE